MTSPLLSKFTIKSFKENRMFHCNTTRNCQYGPRSAASRLIATAAIAATTLAASGVVSAETSQYYSAAVSGLRVGMGTDHFGSVSEDKVPVYESINGTYWGTSASATDAGGETVSVRTSIMSPPSATPTYIDSLQALASLKYSFVLDGPATTSKIPVLLTGSGSVFANPNTGYADLLFEFSAHADGVLVDCSLDTLGPTTGPDVTSHSFFELADDGRQLWCNRIMDAASRYSCNLRP